MNKLITLSIALAMAHSQLANAQSFSVIDGDSFIRNDVQMRLYGIDAPELHQTCDGVPVGKMAQQRLGQLLRDGGAAVTCQSKGKDRYGRSLVICVDPKQKIDINRTLVEEGLAFAYKRYTMAYADYEGWGPVHQYHCENPETWRHRK